MCESLKTVQNVNIYDSENLSIISITGSINHNVCKLAPIVNYVTVCASQFDFPRKYLLSELVQSHFDRKTFFGIYLIFSTVT